MKIITSHLPLLWIVGGTPLEEPRPFTDLFMDHQVGPIITVVQWPLLLVPPQVLIQALRCSMDPRVVGDQCQDHPMEACQDRPMDPQVVGVRCQDHPMDPQVVCQDRPMGPLEGCQDHYPMVVGDQCQDPPMDPWEVGGRCTGHHRQEGYLPLTIMGVLVILGLTPRLNLPICEGAEDLPSAPLLDHLIILYMIIDSVQFPSEGDPILPQMPPPQRACTPCPPAPPPGLLHLPRRHQIWASLITYPQSLVGAVPLLIWDTLDLTICPCLVRGLLPPGKGVHPIQEILDLFHPLALMDLVMPPLLGLFPQ